MLGESFEGRGGEAVGRAGVGLIRFFKNYFVILEYIIHFSKLF